MSDFVETEERKSPYVFLQWKNTDSCFDFHCDCGEHCHFDGDFAYVVKCPKCQQLWEMPCILYPRKVCDKTYPGHIEMAKTMEGDDEE